MSLGDIDQHTAGDTGPTQFEFFGRNFGEPYFDDRIHSSVLDYYEDLFYSTFTDAPATNTFKGGSGYDGWTPENFMSPALKKFFNPKLLVTQDDVDFELDTMRDLFAGTLPVVYQALCMQFRLHEDCTSY